MEALKVEKFSTSDRGNGLRALVPLRPGELLFRSDPLAYTVCKGSRGVVCDRCLLGYVRSPLARLSPVSAASQVQRACEGAARPGTSPGSAVLPKCPAPHSSRAADRLRAATPLGCCAGGWRRPRLSPCSSVGRCWSC